MWARIICALVGVWLMASPEIFDFSKNISDNDQIVGPVIFTFSVIAMGESVRNIRWLNVGLGCWLLLAPWILNYHNGIATVNDMICGALAIGLSFVPQKRHHWFNGGWSALWK